MKKTRSRKSDVELVEEAMSTEEVMEKAVSEMSDEEAQEIVDLSADYQAGPQAVEVDDHVMVNIPIYLKIKRKEYQPGLHKIPAHLLPVIREMLYKKRNADLSMFVGKNYLIERLLDRTLVVKEVDELNLKKI